MRLKIPAIIVMGLLCLGGCSHRAGDDLSQEQKQDPFESINRKIFRFNQFVDGLIFEPASNFYKMTVNEEVQKSISYFLYNLAEPVTMSNDFLQGKGSRGLEAFSRFLINTTFGVFGLFDVAEKLGLPRHQEDFGQTLAVWGVSSGPYIVVPLLGPATPRSLTGRFSDFYLSPYNYYMVHHDRQKYIYIRLGVETIVRRAQYGDDIKNFKENSLDFYAAVRSFYLQNRRSKIQDGKGLSDEAPGADAFNVDDDDFWED